MTPQPPIFIVAPARSGTTVLSHMIASRLELACSPETNVMGILSRIQHMAPDMTFGQFQERQLEFLMHGKTRPYCMLIDSTLAQTRIMEHPREFAEMLIHMDQYSDGLSVLEQTPRNGEHLCSLRWLFPEAVIIFLMRNPFDVIQSNRATPWGTRNTFILFSIWARQYVELIRLFRTYGRNRTIVVRYSQLEKPGYREQLLQRLRKFGVASRPTPVTIKAKNFDSNEWAAAHMSNSVSSFKSNETDKWTERHPWLRDLGDGMMVSALRFARGRARPTWQVRLLKAAGNFSQRVVRR